jgi:hypothetical protein
MSLTDQQLRILAKKMSIPLERVCFKDELSEEPLKYNVGYIINMEDERDEQGNYNDGSHWTCFQVNKYPNGNKEAIYFDSFGKIYPKAVEEFAGKMPYTTKDIQSAMNEACGWYCLAFLHWINSYEGRQKHLYTDVENFMELFVDLEKSADWKQNEYMLRQFFRSSDPALRKEIDVFADPNTIV